MLQYEKAAFICEKQKTKTKFEWKHEFYEWTIDYLALIRESSSSTKKNDYSLLYKAG